MFRFDNTYARLPERFFERVAPKPVRGPRLLKVNAALAEMLGVEPAWLGSDEATAVFAGNLVPAGAEPIAQAYAGHQFGSFVPQLGDGRAILLGEVVGADGVRRDVQLKGSGRTRFSRGGDGRAALGPVLREYLLGEGMAALGVPTTRALAAVTTGEIVMRDEPLPGAILTRVAASHLRIGTFQFFAAQRDLEGLRTLTSYAIARHYPESRDGENAAIALLDEVVAAQASLVARWMGVGFIHGVMNTDNTSISGETIDYGPCAFLDEYHPNKKFSSIDRMGRYAFASQPRIALWNLGRLADALLPIVASDEKKAIRWATERLDRFQPLFDEAYLRVMSAKIGVTSDGFHDRFLIEDLLERLAANEVDFTVFFRRLCDAVDDPAEEERVASLFAHPGAFHDWSVRWRARLARDDAARGREPGARAAAMRRENPAFIPRNHRIEAAIAAAVGRSDFAPFERLVEVLARPWEDQPEHRDLAAPPAPEQRVAKTFCGT